MERDLLKTRRRRQVFPECLLGCLQLVPGVQIVERARKIHEEKQKRGETSRGGKGQRTAFSRSRPPVPPRFPGVQLSELYSLPTYRRALLSERLQQGRLSSKIFNFIYPKQLTRENYGIVESKEKRELCMPLHESATDYIKIMCHV